MYAFVASPSRHRDSKWWSNAAIFFSVFLGAAGAAAKCRAGLKSPPFGEDYWQGEEEPHLERVGLKGFEPSTSASRTQRSSQAELQPDVLPGENYSRPTPSAVNR